eukprot:14203785-Ditylum_brightwellii.AAC.1
MNTSSFLGGMVDNISGPRLMATSDCNVTTTYSRTHETAVVCMNVSSLSVSSYDAKYDSGDDMFCRGKRSNAGPILLESRDAGVTWTNMMTFSKEEDDGKGSLPSKSAPSSRGLTNGNSNKPPALAFMPSLPIASSLSPFHTVERRSEGRLFAFGYEDEHC